MHGVPRLGGHFSGMRRRGRECSEPPGGSARSPARRKCAGSDSSTARTSRSASIRPSPTRGSSSSGPTCPAGRRSRRGWIRSCPRSGGRPSAAARPRVEMIEHVMAALAGLQVDNAVVEIDAGECPGCDGSSRAFVEAIDGAGIVEQDRMRPALVVEEPMSIRDGDAVLADPPARPVRRPDALVSPRLRPGRADPRRRATASACRPTRSARSSRPAGPSCSRPRPRRCGPPGSACGPPRPTCCSSAATASSATRCASRTSAPGTRSWTWSATWRLLGADLHGFVVAYRSGHQTNAALGRRLLEAGAARRGRRPRAAAAPRGRHDRRRRHHEPAAASLPVPAGRPGARAGPAASAWWGSRT